MRGFTTIWIAMAAAAALGGCERERSSEPITVRKVEADTGLIEPAPVSGNAERIQARLLSDPMLSPAARRISIVEQNGIVTLRGVVATEQERSRVDRLATDAAGNAMVRDELEVMSSEPVAAGGSEREPVTTGEREPMTTGEREPGATPPMQPATPPAQNPASPAVVIIVPPPGMTPPVAPGTIVDSGVPSTAAGTTPGTTRPGLTAPGEPAQRPGTEGSVPGTTAPAPTGISPGTTTTAPSTRPAAPPPPPATPAPTGGAR